MLEISPGFPHPLPPNAHGIFHSARQPPSSSLPPPPSRSSLAISSCLSAANTVGGDNNATANSSSSPTVAKLGARKRPHITMPGGGRPPKRPSDQGCSPTTSPPSPAKAKLPRLDRGPEDFSSVVKSKLQSYTRTGQACDRCKVRKIRCDALPEGCSHCASQRLECYVTDRVTGRTERRGYLQELEREKSDMLNHIRQLEELINSKGINIKPWSWSAFGKPAHPLGMLVDTTGAPINVSNTDGSSWTKSEAAPARAKNLSLGATRSSVLLPRPGDSHIGVFQDKAPLSAVKGTQLSILGATIDVTDFDAEDMEEPAPGFQATEPFYNKSLFSFVQSVMHKQPPPPIELPSKDEAFQYSEWYFVMIFPFVPVLHKPTHMRLLARIYDEPGFKPSSAELAIVHMVLAMIYFQYGIRNREEADRRIMLNELSNKHYHWCLHTISDVIADTSVTSVQALVLMAIHARGFPKPGCASLIASYAVNKCIELNLHRESKPPGAPTNLDHELRKRAWWSALSMLVTLNGRLGRPMPLNVKEFDTGYPVPIDDEYLTEDGIVDESKIGHCHHMVGLVGFKTATMYMRMHTEIYGVRRDPASYIDTVNELDEEYRIWEENLPDDLNIAKCKPGEQVFALYAQAFSLEFRFCLRHPSVCMTDDPKFIAENNRICEETARALLKHVEILLRLKSLDTTWYQISVYCAVMFTILVAHWERRYETTPAEVSQLKEDADTWLAIITEICLLVGSTSGERLSNEIRQIITRTIAWIERDMGRAPGTVSPNQPQNGGQQQQTPQIKQEPSHFTHISIPPATAAVVNSSSSMAASTIAQNNGSNAYYGSNGAAQTTPYPTQLAYQPQSATTTHTGNGMSYDPHDQASYLYAATAAAAAISQGNSAGVSEPHETNPLVAFASQATSHVGSNTNTWHDWTAAIADSQDRYSANALLNIAAGPARDGGLGLDQAGGAHHGHGPAANGLGVSMGGSGAHTQWPLILFHDANGAVSSG